ncbi:hypothetical protein IJ579_01285 [bacterium]|nr:hypothetical protein [bacterium]
MGYAVNLNLNKFAQSARSVGTGETNGSSKTSKSAAANLKKTNRSTVNKHFTLNTSTGGIAARRSVTAHTYGRANYNNYRASNIGLSADTVISMPSYSPPVVTQTTEVKTEWWEDLLKGGFALANTFLTAKTNSAKLDAATGALSSGDIPSLDSGPASDAIDEMNGATDSSSLSSAIQSANGQLQAMNNNTQKVAEAKQKATQQQTAVNKQLGEATNQYNLATQEQATAKQSMQSATTARDAALQQMEEDNSAWVQSKQAHNAAHAATQRQEGVVANLEAQLSNTPKQIPDGNGGMKSNPAYTQLKQKLEQAKTELKNLQAKEKEAKAAMEKAETTLDKSKQSYKDNVDALNKAEKNLSKAEKQAKTAQENLGKAKAAQDECNRQLQEINQTISQCNQYNTQKAALEKSIQDNQARLKQMQSDGN